MHYGLGYCAYSGDGFEHCVAQFLQVLLLGCEGRTELELIQKLCSDHTAIGRTSRLLHTGTVVCGSPIKLEPTDRADVKYKTIFQWIANEVRRNMAVVVINAAQSSFADLLVFLPGDVILLLQVKHYGDNTELDEVTAWAELHKMGYRDNMSAAGAYCKTINVTDATEHHPQFVKGNCVRRQELFHTILEGREKMNANVMSDSVLLPKMKETVYSKEAASNVLNSLSDSAPLLAKMKDAIYSPEAASNVKIHFGFVVKAKSQSDSSGVPPSHSRPRPNKFPGEVLWLVANKDTLYPVPMPEQTVASPEPGKPVVLFCSDVEIHARK